MLSVHLECILRSVQSGSAYSGPNARHARQKIHISAEIMNIVAMPVRIEIIVQIAMGIGAGQFSDAATRI